MRKLFAVLSIGLALLATPVLAAPHFQSVSATRDGDNLVVSFDEAGLGNQDVTIVASASVSRTDQCINRGGNVPSDPKKTTVVSTSTAGDSFEPKNGRIIDSLTLLAPGSTLDCPPGQTATLVSLTYTNVLVRDTTNDVEAAVPGSF